MAVNRQHGSCRRRTAGLTCIIWSSTARRLPHLPLPWHPYSCIDIVATDCSTITVTSAAPVGGSDHFSINVHINSPPHPHPIGSVKRVARWRWLPHNVLSLRQSLADADLIGNPPLDTPDSNEVTELWTNWRNTVLQLTTMPRLPSNSLPTGTLAHPGPG